MSIWLCHSTRDDVLKLQKEQESEDNFIVQYCCNKCQTRTFTRAGYETHLLHAHQIRNADKYPPTLLRKTFKSPESLHVNQSAVQTTNMKRTLKKKVRMKKPVWTQLQKNQLLEITTTLTTLITVK